MRGLTTGAAIAALTLGLTAGLAACSKAKDDTAAAGAGTPAAEAPAATPTAAKPPRPRTGKWKITTTMEGAGGMTLPATETCFTPEMVEGDAWAAGQRPEGMDCDPPSTSFAGGVMSTHSVCRFDGRTTTSDIKASGDFSRAYTMEMTTSTAPAPPGMPNPMRMKITAERLGDC